MSIILNDRDKALQAATFRTMSTTVDIVSSNGQAFRTLKNGGDTTPTNTTLTATASSIFTTAAIYTWQYSLSNSSTIWVPISAGTTNTLVITNTSILANIGTATSINYKCVVTESGLITATGIYNITYSKELSESIVVDMNRTNAVIPCSSDGTPTGFTNTDTTISVSRGGTALSYSGTGGANTFKVTIQADEVSRTVGTVSTTTNSYSISGITALNVDIATVVFAVTVYDAAGVALSPIGKQITYTKVTNGVVGADITSYYIDSTSPVISKTTSGALLPGTHTQITITGKKAAGSGLPATYGYLTLTPNGVSEATVATAGTITTNIGNSDGKTIYTINMYNQATRSGATLLDTMTVPVVFTGANAITAILTNESTSIPTNFSGTVGVYTNSGTDIHVYEGSTELTYDGVGSTTGTWAVSTFASNITIGAITDAGLYAKVANASNILSSTASIVYTITGVSGAGAPFTIVKTQSFGRTTDGKDGASFAITNSFATFNKDAAGNKTPATLTLSTDSQNITNITKYQWQKNGINIATGGTTASYTVPIADYALVNTNTYNCTVTGTINAVVGSTLSDQITIPLLADGAGAINILNSNENITFTAPNTGYTGIIFGNSSVSISAFIGTVALQYDETAVPANNTFKVTRAAQGFVVPAGTFVAGGTTYNVAAPTSASMDSGYVIFTITIKDNFGVSTTSTSTTTYSLSRLGNPPPIFNITNSGATIIKNEAGVLAPTSLTLYTNIANITSPVYQWYKGASLISGASTASYTIIAATDYTTAGVDTNTYRCTVTGTVAGVSTTFTDYLTVPLLVAGSSAVTLNNSNENILFSASNTGYSGITFTSGSFIVRAYIGTVGLTYDGGVTPGNNTFKVSQVTVGATVATVLPVLGSLTYTVPAPTAMSADSASTVVTVTIKNAAGVTSIIDTTTTYGLSRVGPTAGVFNITNSAVVFTKNSAGIINPTSSILTTSSQNITSPIYQWYKNTIDTGITTATYTIPTSDFDLVNTNTYKCTVTGTIAGVASSSLSDQITVPLLSDGSSAITVNNSNENITFPSSNTGQDNINFTNGGFVIRAYIGTAALNYNATLALNSTFKVTVVTTGATVGTGTIGANTYTVPAPTAMSADSASTIVTVTVKNAAGVTTDIVTTTTYSLSRVGPLGSNFSIVNSIVAFTKSSTGGISPATATLSTTYLNIGSPQYKWYKNTVDTGITTSTYDIVAATDYASVVTNTYKCIVTGTINGIASSTLSDQITAPMLTDGATTPTIINSNENITFIAENSGYNNISFTKGSFTIKAYLGTTALKYDESASPLTSTFKVTFSATGATVAAGSGADSTYTVPAPSAIGADSASNLLTITIKDAAGVISTFTKTTYYNLSRMGNPGASFVITNSFAAFNKDAAGNKTPATLTLNTTSQNITAITGYQWYKNTVAISGATTGVYIVPISDYALVSTNTYKCTISGTFNGTVNTISDQITIPLLADGAGAINILNSNENITFTAPTSGYTGIAFGSSTVVISAVIGTVALTYDATATPGNNTFKVTQSVSGFTVAAGTFVAGGTTYTVLAPTAATADSGFITFTVIVKDNLGVSTTNTTTTTYSLSRIGITPPIFNIANSAAVFTKNEAGTITPTTLTLSTNSQNIAATPIPTYQWQKNGSNIPGATAATYNIVAATDYTTAGVDTNIYKCTVTGTMSGVAAQTLFDQITVPLLIAGSSAITVNNSNENIVFSAPNTGYTPITFTSGGFIIRAYIGTTALTYEAANTTNSTFKVAVVTTGATVAVGSSTSSNTYTVPAPTAMSTDSASTVVTVTIRNAAGVISVIDTTTTYGLSRVGPTGVGNKSVTISAYAWGLTMPDIPTTSYVYTWATGAITYPTGWVKQPTIGTTGQTLYQINLIITGTTSDVTTSGIDWAAATSNTVGYRLDGSIGPQGTSARKAYAITTRITPPPSPTSGTGDVIPSSKVTNTDGTEVPWVLVAQDVLLPNYYMYTVDGIYTGDAAATINGVSVAKQTTAWGTPYLSNLKVGSLSAISANLGVINAGSLNINNKFMVANDGATTIQSGSTGSRMVMTENFIKIFQDVGGVSVLRVQLGNLSM